MNKKILLVGTVSNVAKTIEKELKIVLKALSIFDSVEVFLVESDSIDETLNKLNEIILKNSNIKYVSLGNLRSSIANRIERLRYCRNHYVEYIRVNNSIKNWDFVIVADLDGMNLKINAKSISTCFINSPEWDGVMANQKYGYYDLLALRADGWMEYDCFELLSSGKQQVSPYKPRKNRLVDFIFAFLYYDNLRNQFIYSKMKKIATNQPWIKVKSAFGALAIYKTDLFILEDYSHKEANGKSAIDHVDFNLKCFRNGANFYINPNLINSKWNVYNLNRIKLIRFFKEIKKQSKLIKT